MAPKKPANIPISDIRSPSPALSPTSTLVDGSPREARTPVRHRPTFARLASVLDPTNQRYDVVKDEDDTTGTTESIAGLGISYGPDAIHARSFSGSTAGDRIDISYDSGATKGGPYDADSPYWSPASRAKRSTTSFSSSTLQPSWSSPSDTHLLRGKPSFAETVKSYYDDFAPSSTCPSRRQFHYSCWSWPSMLIFILAIYSTVFSGIYLIIAARGPRYGKYIGTHGVLTSANANLLTAFFAKTIEISFSTVFVAFIGQVLWRRAFQQSKSRGVTLAEMDMRSWVMQPGTMLTHFGAMRQSVLSILGALTLVAAFMTMLYTTSSEALVQPRLRYGKSERLSMSGLVKSSWANSLYLSKICSSPTKDGDTEHGGTTCLQIEYAAQAYHNYQRYLSDWDAPVQYGNGSKVLNGRPQGFALVTENTTVTAQWVDMENTGNITDDGRIINNVSMAMPHIGVTSAARDGRNGIIQPEELDGLGVYNLRASVPSPVINVLCVNMNGTDLAPIVYNDFPQSKGQYNAATWTQDSSQIGDEFKSNQTVVDDLFGWGQQYGQTPPLFGRLPADYNTVMNHSGPYGRNAIYLLGKSASTPEYFLCAIKAYLTPNCSTSYNVSSSGATLEARCEDPDDEMRYLNSLWNATSGAATISNDWATGATDWANSLSLNAGVTDGNASNARLLTQLGLTGNPVGLDPVRPSPAEAIAVMAGCTLLMGMQDTPFVTYWDYTKTILEAEQYQTFNATLKAQQYASGGIRGYQHGFFVVLTLVFILNLGCLVYFSVHKSMITDYSEPVNLFSLAVNSPPSTVMAGSCGAGPEGKQYRVPWYVNAAGDHLYIESQAGGEEEGHELNNVGSGAAYEEQLSPVRRAFDRLSKQASFI